MKIGFMHPFSYFSQKVLPITLALNLLATSSYAQSATYGSRTWLSQLKIGQQECVKTAKLAVQSVSEEPIQQDRGTIYGWAAKNDVTISIICLEVENYSVVSI